jgi:hypothetical protein
MRFLAAFAVLLALPFPSNATTQLILHYEALQRVLAAQAFTQDGRNYVKGSKDTKCSYAYLESPRIGADNGRLQVKARFSGRSALDILGRCIGLGDSFDLTILVTPYYRDGALAFKDVSVSSNGRDGIYIRRVRTALTRSLERDFSYPLRTEAKVLLEEKRSALHRQEVVRFDVSAVQVTPAALVLALELELAVK